MASLPAFFLLSLAAPHLFSPAASRPLHFMKDSSLDGGGGGGRGQIVRNRTDGLCSRLVLPHPGYSCSEYMVLTGDGFLLGLQRMSRMGRPLALQKSNNAVFLMHGLLVGGDVWVLNGPSEALGFILADAGYDVWIGNTRTTRFSFGHSTYQKTDHEYWDWSVDEMSDQDLPAMLGFVYESTNAKLDYIGYSQGAQQAFAAFSQGQLLQFVDKIIMLAPVAYVDHGTAPVETGLFVLHIDQILQLANVHEFNTQTSSGAQVVELICKTNVACYEEWVFLFAGDNCCLNMSKRHLLDQYETQGTSVKNLAHLAQQGRTSSFAKYDYGLLGNLRRYGAASPPLYSLSRIPTQKMLLINSARDALADPFDVARLVVELGNRVEVHTDPDFGHLDFILADTANAQIYSRILAFLGSPSATP